MRYRLLVPIVGFVLLAVLPAGASGKSCSSVVNPYPGSRFDGVNLSQIRAKGISCPRARKVAKEAHRKALGLTPTPSGKSQFGWNGWTVSENLRPASDKYTAKRKGQSVRWRF